MIFHFLDWWPILGGRVMVPPGTILDHDVTWVWNGFALPWPPPITVAALDQSAYDQLYIYYPYFRIMTGPGIVRQTSGGGQPYGAWPNPPWAQPYAQP
jgi:hypothetical protein